MAVSSSLFSDDLLQALYTKPYAGIVSYLSPSDHLTVMDFDRSALAKDHWLDEPQMYGGSKGRKRRDPNTIFKVFSLLDEEEDYKTVHENMIQNVVDEFNWFGCIAMVCLQMHKISLSAWIGKMQSDTCPGDELAVYVLSRMYGKHSVIYTKTKTWSTVGTSQPISEKELYKLCELKFVSMGRGQLIELVRKPSSLMPIVSTTPLQSTYDSGYYETDYIKQEPDYDESMGSSTAVLPPKTDSALNLNNFDQDIKGHTHTKYCPVHGCDTTQDTFETMCEDNANDPPLEIQSM